ncbi:D-tyrosyl-tRNA(Tyr) deacylase [Dendrobium catenatum]|uniref:D-tyrosyl-tRNA(Tyr) deacylase n=1 Tax=Dendrobium catenatum TaxID=906689 RepID=A0A2I0WC77_9ASPA|nr:D-tyrosyl-tRNA(Tyr) deacylase [Dendrobium catenatum]
MRAIVQRVLSASVEVGDKTLAFSQPFNGEYPYLIASLQVEGRLVSEIGPGLLVFIGIHESDVEADADYMCVFPMSLFIAFFSLYWRNSTPLNAYCPGAARCFEKFITLKNNCGKFEYGVCLDCY